MALSKIVAVSLAASALHLNAVGPACAQAADKPVPRSTKERGAVPQADAVRTTGSGGLTKEQRVTICLDTWDAQTHMTRREWRIACERSVELEPGVFR